MVQHFSSSRRLQSRKVSFPVTLMLSMFLNAAIMVSVINASGLKDSDIGPNQPIPFLELNGTKFRIYKKRLSWENASAYCVKCSGRFATASNLAELKNLRDAIYNISHFSQEYDYKVKREEFGLDRRYWIGMRAKMPDERIWKWVKNEKIPPKIVENPLSYPWYRNITFRENQTDHCVAFVNPMYHLDNKPIRFQKHTLKDMDSCKAGAYFICEKDPSLVTSESECIHPPVPPTLAPSPVDPKANNSNGANSHFKQFNLFKGLPPYVSININGFADKNKYSIINIPGK